MRPGDDVSYTTAGHGHDAPLLLDTVLGAGLPDSDFQFFRSALPPAEPSSPGAVASDYVLATSPNLPALQGQQTLSNTSSVSPISSTHHSSSNSSPGHKRKSSSESSLSALARADVMMTDDADMSEWKVDELMTGGDGPTFGGFGGRFLPVSSDTLAGDADFESSNKVMENHFDFESAASSPGPLDAAAGVPSHASKPANSFKVPYREAEPMHDAYLRDGQMSSASNAQRGLGGFSAGASREPSPMQGLGGSQGSSPMALFTATTPPAPAGFVSGALLTRSPGNPVWPTGAELAGGAVRTLSDPRTTPSPYLTDLSSPPASDGGEKPALTIHPTPLKSRVETQIPIKMTLHPMPPGVTKLHLPTHTISKPKLLAKPGPEPSSDTLELHTMLVCTSAMQAPEKLRRALAYAAGDGPGTRDSKRRSSSGDSPAADDDDDEAKPLNGGEVDICVGCITRERKRAARKKVKKVEEEDSWHRDEHRRIIVFNTHEIKEWQQPSEDSVDEIHGRPVPQVPEGAMQVDAPMRIACYCRHQNEKLGFQVIFTIKDHRGRLVAQAITSSIMITDDHKTHAPPLIPPTSAAQSMPEPGHLPGAGVFTSGPPAFGVPSAAPVGMAPFRLSHSSSDLQSLQHGYSSPYGPTPRAPPPTFQDIPRVPQAATASSTPRTLSRQASPTGGQGHSAKKRKSSGAGKVPSGLAMTRLENSQPQPTQGGPAGPQMGVIASSAPPSYAPSFHPFGPSAERGLPPPQSVMAGQPSQYHAGTSTPNHDQGFLNAANRSHSMENLPVSQMFSAPVSTHQSRAASPNGTSRNGVNPYHQAQMAQAVANGIYGLPSSLNSQRPPTIHKLIPNEGPKAGGIEVTCLGSGFCQGLEVMFGETMATTTTYWGESSLVCLLPPAVRAGMVAVTFKHEQQQQQQGYPGPPIPTQQALFKYTDDDEQQLMRMALSVLGHKMTGKMEDVREIARRIVAGGGNKYNGGAAGSANGGTQQQRPASALDPTVSTVDAEAAMLKCLELIDLDDSAHQPRLNLRRSSGQTMLHLACSLGLHRFVAALLARGANPDPRDKGGFSPMHFAALHDHPHIVRRLILNGADPTMRSLQGYTPADLATTEEVLRSTRKVEHHSRTRSGPSAPFGGRANSTASLRSLWAPGPAMHKQPASARGPSEYGQSEHDGPSDDDRDEDAKDGRLWSRRNSRASTTSDAVENPSIADLQPPQDGSAAGAAASMTAWKAQLSTQLQHLQQTVQGNLPNLRQIPALPPMPQIPALPPMPNLPAYQAYLPNPMARRFGSLVPNRPASLPSVASGEAGAAKEGEYRWWELFSGSAPPPSYDDIYPHPDEQDLKRTSAVQAALDTVADQKCAEAFDEPVVSGSSQSGQSALDAIDVRFGRTPMSKEEQTQLRMAHAKKIKKIKSDRNLFFIWIPLLILIIVAMLKNRVPEAWNGASQVYGEFRSRHTSGRVVQELL
ncbi:MAG: hypothetical protein M1832_003868 [Thelocarpon impressellum]|nr:MAG: hypothetical protein M1832_003868 [Thelocarpon impressellum]